MDKRAEYAVKKAEECRKDILEVERHIWENPETGYREWKTHAYLKERYEKLGYTVKEAGNIPGFYVDIDTGKPGPCIAFFGEMDSLIVPTHPEADPETGAVHACGHNCQCASVYGLAAILADGRLLEDFCGSIRLFAVPAEELIETDFRAELKEKGIIKYFGGKQEFMHRGYLNGVDAAVLFHASTDPGIGCAVGTNGCVLKKAEFTGKSCHAAEPVHGINALYAANCALNAANALREVFPEEETIRFHPIITKGGSAVNAIPDRVCVESYVRGRTMDAIYKANKKINRAFAAGAAAMGAELIITDRHGYAPRDNDKNLRALVGETAKHFFADTEINTEIGWGLGCSDIGDVSSVIPSVQVWIGGAEGTEHGADYRIADPGCACVTAAKMQSLMALSLLGNGAEKAKEIIKNARVAYNSAEAFFKAADAFDFCAEAVEYGEDGTAVLKFCNEMKN